MSEERVHFVDQSGTAPAPLDLWPAVIISKERIDAEIEWAFDATTAALDYDGRIEAYDGIIGQVSPLPGDGGTAMTGPMSWRSTRKDESRRGVAVSFLYMCTSRWRRVWPYHAQPEDVSRSRRAAAC